MHVTSCVYFSTLLTKINLLKFYFSRIFNKKHDSTFDVSAIVQDLSFWSVISYFDKKKIVKTDVIGYTIVSDHVALANEDLR